MRKGIATLLAAALLPVLALRSHADVCSDLTQVYTQKLATLASDMEAALRTATDPNELEAIRASFEMQKIQIEAERDSLLASSGCLPGSTLPPPDDTTIPPPDTTIPPPDDTTLPPPDDTTLPPPDDTTIPPPVVEPPTAGDSCQESLVAYSEQLDVQGVDAKEKMHLIQAKAHELGCNYGLYNAGTRTPDRLNGKHISKPLGYNKDHPGRGR